MITDQTNNQSADALNTTGVVMLVNTFTPKPGMEQAFIEAQTGEYIRLKGRVPGWLGNRLGRAVDHNGPLVNVALFATMSQYNAWRASDLFLEHVDVIKPYVERAAPALYEVIYSA